MTKEEILNWSADQQLLAKVAPNRTNKYGAIIFEKFDIRLIAINFVNEADKIDIIIKFDQDFLTVLSLIDLFRSEQDTIKKDKNGYFKTVSFVGWIKRNNAQQYFDTQYRYGSLRKYHDGNHNFYLDQMVKDDERADFINRVFLLKLIELREKELEYWFNHDEYTLLKRRWEKEHITNFGVPIAFCSSGQILIRDTEAEAREREITIDELKQLLEMNDKLKAYIQHLTDECDIKY